MKKICECCHKEVEILAAGTNKSFNGGLGRKLCLDCWDAEWFGHKLVSAPEGMIAKSIIQNLWDLK